MPNEAQKELLLATLQEANATCNSISSIAFSSRIFNQFKIHNEVYHKIKQTSELSSQMLVRCISKVADAYKIDKKVQRVFRPLGSIAYDCRILTYKQGKVSIWCIGGRQTVDFICHNEKYLPYVKGEADLVFSKGKFYLFQTVEIPEETIEDVEEFIGCHF